jgi:hypothetical protein
MLLPPFKQRENLIPCEENPPAEADAPLLAGEGYCHLSDHVGRPLG